MELAPNLFSRRRHFYVRLSTRTSPCSPRCMPLFMSYVHSTSRMSRRTTHGSRNTAHTLTDTASIPHDVLRDKRGQACTKCRQVKLRCIRQEGHASCIRCEKRQEECTFAPRTHDSQWHEHIASDLYKALDHLSRLTEHVNTLARSLSGSDSVPLFRLPDYQLSDSVEGDIQPEPRAPRKRRRGHGQGEQDALSRAALTSTTVDASALPADRSTPANSPHSNSLVPRQNDDPSSGDQMESDGPVLSAINLARPFLGCDDPRVNIITKLIITPAEAQDLVSFFNDRIAPSLLGFNPIQIPYHPGGLTHISPLVLAVVCAIASERDPRHASRHTKALYHEVFRLLASSPTGSFMGNIDLETVRLIPEDWDPELGIGPEEVVAVSYLALFIDDRIRGPNIGRLSRRWVEGYISWSQSPGDHTTLGESIGLLPAPRHISSSDVSRIWMLSFISRRLSDIQSHYPSSTMPDPDEHCTTLSESPSPEPGDTTLIQSTRLIAALSKWYEAWRENEDVMNRFESTRKANLAFDEAQLELESADLTSSPNPVFRMIYLFAKAVTHASLARICDPTSEDQRALKRPNWAAGVDVSVEMLRLCSDMPAALLTNLPIALYTMLDQAVEILLEAAKTSNTFWLAGVTHHMESLASSLSSSSLPTGHTTRNSARLLHMAISSLSGKNIHHTDEVPGPSSGEMPMV